MVALNLTNLPAVENMQSIENKKILELMNINRYSVGMYYDYYNGKQPLTYTTDRYKNAFAKMVQSFKENMCPTVVDSVADRLIVTGFEVEGSDAENTGQLIWDIWKNNRLEIRSGDIHQEAVKCGNAYLIVWPNSNGYPTFHPQSSDSFIVHYDEDEDFIDWAAKIWITDQKLARLTVYYADRVERFISSGAVRGFPTKNVIWKPLAEGASVPNPYGKVPVFHFANNAMMSNYGKSDLHDVLTIQDALNKSVADLLVSMEFAAFNQRWATGLEMQIGPDGKPKPTFEPGPDRLWATESEDAEFGEFTAADLTKFIAVHDMFLVSIARITGVPIHHMLINSGNFPSGESLKTAESRFTAKITDRQKTFGATWEDALTFAAEIARLSITGKVHIQWASSAPRSERETAEVMQLKKALGFPFPSIAREMGYSQQQIDQIQAEQKAETAAVTTPVSEGDE
jgi:hypothetical protein